MGVAGAGSEDSETLASRVTLGLGFMLLGSKGSGSSAKNLLGKIHSSLPGPYCLFRDLYLYQLESATHAAGQP